MHLAAIFDFKMAALRGSIYVPPGVAFEMRFNSMLQLYCNRVNVMFVAQYILGPLRRKRHFRRRPSWNPIWRPYHVNNNATIRLVVPKNIGVATWITLLCRLDQKLWTKIWFQADGWRPSLISRWRPPGGHFHVSPILESLSMKNSITAQNFVVLDTNLLNSVDWPLQFPQIWRKWAD